MEDLLKKRLIDFTGEGLIELLKPYLQTEPITKTDFSEAGKFVYGLAGIAQLFGCSITTANRIKQSGKITPAITQIGNKIIVDAEKALMLANRKDKR
ncbi:MAG: DUF3853 family protein [Muribaculaceae bacterium]